jgi:hypothetical protein
MYDQTLAPNPRCKQQVVEKADRYGSLTMVVVLSDAVCVLGCIEPSRNRNFQFHNSSNVVCGKSLPVDNPLLPYLRPRVVGICGAACIGT